MTTHDLGVIGQEDQTGGTSLLQIRIKDHLRDEAREAAHAIGITLSGFVRMAVIEKLTRLRLEARQVAHA